MFLFTRLRRSTGERVRHAGIKTKTTYEFMEWSARFTKPEFCRVFFVGKSVTISTLGYLFEVICAISKHLARQIRHVTVASMVNHCVMND